MKRKVISILLCAAMVSTMLAGCGSSSTNTTQETTEAGTTEADASVSSSDDSKEIIFWNTGTEGVDKQLMDMVVKKFNETTTSGYTVKSVPTQNDTYKEKLVIAMSSGECPDIYTSWAGGPMNEYIEAGFAQPIDDLMNASDLPDKLMEASLEQAKYKDKTYGVPFLNVAVSGIYYNTEIFEKYNIEVPKTITELEAACDTLVANGITPFALANATKWTGSMYFMNLAARKGGLEPFQKAVDGSGTFEDECFKYAGEKIQEWVKKGYFPEGVNSLSEDDGQSKQLIYQETAAMECIGSWMTGTFKSDSEEFAQKLGWFPFPAGDDASIDSSILIGTIGDNFIHFNCTDEKQAAAFEFASMFTDDDVIQFMADNGKIPPVKNAADLITDPMTTQILKAATDAGAVQLWYDQYLPPAVATAHLDSCQELFGLTMTPEEADKKFQAAMEEYNNEQK
ncbi:MAG: extracellular solute-binding protein [Lachnospiraceae bacterium]|nr:extracellular solute-binding protein [Lachnospiraceae bacterium]